MHDGRGGEHGKHWELRSLCLRCANSLLKRWGRKVGHEFKSECCGREVARGISCNQ